MIGLDMFKTQASSQGAKLMTFGPKLVLVRGKQREVPPVCKPSYEVDYNDFGIGLGMANEMRP